MTDAATLTGASSPTGTITFSLYGPSDTADCSGTPVDSETAAVAGNGSYATPTGYTPTAAGTYWWTASYGGDSSNSAASSTCGDEQVVSGQAAPSLDGRDAGTTQAGSPVLGFFGLSGGFNPTGLIAFSLYASPDCTNSVYDQQVGVSGDGDYNPVPFTPTYGGVYYWVATYAGDSSNAYATSNCNADPVQVNFP